MPTYEYRCLKCKRKFERLQSMTEKALTRCERCKGKVERLIGGGAGLIFKGSGFYITDYKKQSGPKNASDAPPTAPAKETKEAKKEPVKPANSKEKK